jgi:hypothetical protein
MLLLFYATECALKAVVLRQRNAASTEALDDSLRSHDLGALTKSLRVSAEVGRDVEATYDRRANQGRPMPKVSLARTHEVWRYGANLTDDSNARVKVLLDRLRDWARNELSL